MSIVRLLREGLPSLLPMQGRSPGVHGSTVINDLAIRLGYLSGRAELSTTWAQLGCALERSLIWAYEREFPGRYVQPGEQERDNIYVTPDLADWSPLSDSDLDEETAALIGTAFPVPEECKLSWMTSRHTPRDCESCNAPVCKKMWRYETQIKAQLAMPYFAGAFNGIHYVAKLTVTFVNGRGRGGDGPDGKPWVFAYTPDEVASNWRIIVDHAATLRCRECIGRGYLIDPSLLEFYEAGLLVEKTECADCKGTGVNSGGLAT